MGRVIRRFLKNLGLYEGDAPAGNAQLEREGWTMLPGVFEPAELANLREEVDEIFATMPAERVREDKEEFRYELLNRSAACQQAVAHPRVLEVIEPLLGEDCHVIAQHRVAQPAPTSRAVRGTAMRARTSRGAEGIEWDDRIPYPVFAIGTHIYLQDCNRDDGPTAIVPGSHRSGRLAPFDRMYDPDLTYDGRAAGAHRSRARATSRCSCPTAWHRGLPATADGRGRYFLQVHYGRRDIAQRIRTTDQANHLSPEAIERAKTERERTLAGLHDPFFYDA